MLYFGIRGVFELAFLLPRMYHKEKLIFSTGSINLHEARSGLMYVENKYRNNARNSREFKNSNMSP